MAHKDEEAVACQNTKEVGEANGWRRRKKGSGACPGQVSQTLGNGLNDVCQGQDRRREEFVGIDQATSLFGAGLPSPADPVTKEPVDPRPWNEIHLLIEGHADASQRHARYRRIIQVEV